MTKRAISGPGPYSDGEAERSEHGVRSIGGASRLAAAGLGALVLLWLIIRVSAANALINFGPAAAASLSPKHPEAVLAVAAAQQRATGLSGAPIAYQPFVISARQAILEDDTERASLLLDEAIRRNPRSDSALLLRLDQQIRRNQAADASVTVAVLSRLLPDAGPVLVTQLAQLARDPQVRTALAGVVATDERLRTELLEALARQGADPDAIFSLAGPVGRAIPGATPRWQAIMLEELVSRGQVVRAKQVWNRLAGTEQTPGAIYDPDFRGLPGPPPFNWKLEASAAGFAEPAGDSGLFAEYYGREDAILGQQLLTLSPGSYRFAFDAKGSANGEGGHLTWIVSCHGNGRTIARLPIADLSASETFSVGFSVPAGCAAQWLRLTGEFGEFPQDQRITVSKLRISEAGA